MQIEFQGRLSAGHYGLDQDLRDLQIVTGSNGVTLYAVTGPHGGLSAYTVSGEGLARSLPALAHFPDTGTGTGSWGLIPAETAEGTLLLVDAGHSGALTGYMASGAVQQTGLPGGVVVGELASVGLNDGQLALYVLDDTRGQLHGFKWDNDTADGLDPTPLQTPVPVDVRGGTRLTQASAGENSFLLVASHENGLGIVTSYHVDPVTGGLTVRDQAGAVDGLGVRTPAALESFDAFGQSWIVLAAAGSQSLSVLQLSEDGSLTATDHLIDTRYTRFGSVQAVATLETDGHAFVVAGGNDGGLSLFTLLPSGRLVHLTSLSHWVGAGLQDITALELTRTGDNLQIFVGSESAVGISQFEVPLADLGQVIRDVDAQQGQHHGGAGDDLIVASSGSRDHLLGGAGDDTLVAGDGGTDMTGGAGADLFVLVPAINVTRIFDFEPGSDVLDLSALSLLRAPAQLETDSRADGIHLSFGGTAIRLFSADGTEIKVSDLWPDGVFKGADHFPVDGQALPFDPDTGQQEKHVSGGAGQDTIIGTSADEVLIGGGGADTFLIKSGMGSDTITDFVLGEDRLDFSALTAAQLEAMAVLQRGDDWVISISSHSTLTLIDVGPNSASVGAVAATGWLGVGQTLQAEVGLNDAEGLGSLSYQWYRDGVAITGAVDAEYTLIDTDVGAEISVQVRYRDGLGALETVSSARTKAVVAPIRAPVGDDPAIGTAGADFIIAGADGSTLQGELGEDTLLGSLGADILDGGAGADIGLGGDGKDRLFGWDGNDSLWGEVGNDWLGGGTGHDLLIGYVGHDTILGGAGNDTLRGGGGSDVLEGDDGSDLIYAGNGSDQVHGGGNSDQIDGGPGHDLLAGFVGNDTLKGSGGNDTLKGGGGADSLDGGNGADAAYGGSGGDLLFGGDGRDTLAGGDGKDSLWGDEGSDWLDGGAGHDLLTGYIGYDTILGRAGNDTLRGGGQDDTLEGGADDDILSGGSGADTFVFGPSFANDRVTDFSIGVDQIRFEIADLFFEALVIADSAQGSVITIAEQGTILLNGIDVAMLTEADFQFF
ncbi:MAG: M10 family metallopeptidase C-terminal domain-containing protein [Pseudomonadota bacterium]